MSGVIFDIQRFCLHDGDGIRTTVFFKGCPLRCLWCSNPESQSFFPQISHNDELCIKCMGCVSNCKSLCISDTAPHVVDSELCQTCGCCEEICPTGAKSIKGYTIDAGALLNEIKKDEAFFASSGGGVTFSGGEPFAQSEFLFKMLKLCKENNINTAVETTGFAPFNVISPCLPYIDLILYDIKHVDPQIHKEFTGVDNSIIIQNLKKIKESGARVMVRTPVIPTFNDNESAFDLLGCLLNSLDIASVELLPYHIFGEKKYENLGLIYKMPEYDEGELQCAISKGKTILEGKGIDVLVSG